MGKRIDCNKKKFWCWSKKCKRARKCACDVCAGMKVINPNLYDACIDACQDDPRPASQDSFLCKDVGPETLFNRFGIIKCGYDPYQSLEGQLYLETEAKKEEDKTLQKRIIIGLGIIITMLLLALILD